MSLNFAKSCILACKLQFDNKNLGSPSYLHIVELTTVFRSVLSNKLKETMSAIFIVTLYLAKIDIKLQ